MSHNRTKNSKKRFSFWLVLTLVLTLAFPSFALGNGEKNLISTLQVDSLSLPSIQVDSASIDHKDKLELVEQSKNSASVSRSQFQAEREDGSVVSSNELVQAQNFVPASDSQERITVIVELQTEPTAAYRAMVKSGLLKSDVAHQRTLTAEQESFATAAKKLNASINRQYSHVFNGYSLTIAADQVDRLLEIPGVKAIYEDIIFNVDPMDSITPSMDKSAPHIGSNFFWDLGFDGTGIKVGILDTGIDYNHPSLADAYKGGYDFVDNDDDPMESNIPGFETDHGTHVAGTVGGRGNPDDPNSATGLTRGVAYNSDIYAYRVLGPSGGTTEDILAAIERATLDGMDVINLSLGADVNTRYDPISIALNYSTLDGVISVTSNGNAGPEPYTVGIPATSDLAISVGSSYPPLYEPVAYGDGLDTVYLGIMSYSPDVEEIAGETFEIEYAGLGQPSDLVGKDLTGKVALIQRGAISFGEKSVNAQNAGAEAVIIFNNAPGNFGGTLGEPGDYVPTFSLSQEEGQAILAKINEAEDAYSITFNSQFVEDVMADSSSRGPTLPGLTIKPDVSAPGVAILSTVPAFDGNYEDAYDPKGGTSMAAPHIAGAAALLLQKDSSLTPFEVKSLLMNNALKISDRQGQRYSHMDQGAGRVDLENTLSAKAVALVEEFTDATDNGQVISHLTGSISFGLLAQGSTDSRTVTLKDVVGENSSYTVSTAWYGPAAGTLTLSDTSVSVAANGSTDFNVSLAVSETIPDGQYEGEIILEEANGHLIQIPFAIFTGEAEIPDVVTNITLDPLFFSPNDDGYSDTTDIRFRINESTQYFSLDVYDAVSLEWQGTIIETLTGITPGNYIVRDWDGTVVDLFGSTDLDEGFYVVIPWVGTLSSISPILDQESPFVVDLHAPESRLDDPAITVADGVGTITGEILGDFLVDLLGDYSAIAVAALYQDNGWKQADGTINENGNFSIQVPVKAGLNTFEIYVYDIADNGVAAPAHVVEYTHDDDEEPEPPVDEPGIAAVASPSEVQVGQAFQVSIDFTELTDVYSTQFSLTYDTALNKGTTAPSVTLAAYQEDQNPSVSLIVNENTVDAGDGKVRTDYIVSLAGDFEGYTGSGSLATFNFASDTAGTYQLNLSNVRVISSDAEDVDYGDVTGTTVTVTTGPVEPDPEYTISGNINAQAFGPEVDYSETWYQGSDGVHRVLVEAVDSNGTVAAIAQVSSDGSYVLQVDEGTYTVRVAVPGHIGQSTSVTVDQNVTRNFGPLTAGDVNQDGKVDLVDLQLVAREYGKVRGTGWSNARSSAADINRDNVVDLLDVSFILHNFNSN
ncbi:S8 family serine peptidase [Bacillus horti]|uniref:Minor extracellular serine protease Vpr n=1 Tax=Caldalkalibacillus horti TaxID=77523 RepID=A0ABT9VXU9_9BACI|nr:S8 family serine peptidase [Bacillus horti]MDQ0165823.1 minor extracellular serine protease Vpr [Bacillus horti]